MKVGAPEEGRPLLGASRLRLGHLEHRVMFVLLGEDRVSQGDGRPDVQDAGSAVVYATNGSVWQMYKYDGGWSIDGGPDPASAIGYPRPAQTPFVPDHVGPKTIIIRNFSLNLPPVKPQAVCVKTDVEFDVYGMTAGQSAEAVCAAHGLDALN
jgi:hypothetical protein